MENAGGMARENQALRQRLSCLSEASLRINERLDFGTVLQGVLDRARITTDARYGGIATTDSSGHLEKRVISCLPPSNRRRCTRSTNRHLRSLLKKRGRACGSTGLPARSNLSATRAIHGV